jgi:hypothetical protein
MTKTANTIRYLKLCQRACAEGYPVSYTTDSHWLVNMAINRRAGWQDDPTLARGSAIPVNGKYPVRYAGDRYHHLALLSSAINTPRLIVHESELGEWRRLLLKRLPSRFTRAGEDW